MNRFVVVIILVCNAVSFGDGQSQMFENERNEGSPCYKHLKDGTDDLNEPIKCTPPFKNVVAGSHVEVDPPEMTCGMIPGRPTRYCMQTGGFYRECDECNAYNQEKAHNASYLTDIHSDNNQTWWQSVTLMDDVHTTEVNLTVHLNKSFDIVFVRLKFHSPRPESFAIYKKNRRTPHLEDDYPNEDWIPWQYYSATCRDTYGVPESLFVVQPRDGKTKVMEDRALCTSEYSDISPLTGGNVAYSTLEGRPSAEYFDITPELQQWVSATDIRISLRRLNTFGDEVFADPKVLQSYYYGITHFVVGGRCQCNGHSNVCIPDSEDGSPMCLCQHGTEGRNCESCLPDHWDRPWRRATTENAWVCKACDCNGFSTRCRFNEQLYTQTGRGGECLDCQGNR
jgi:laminin gamma 1